VSAGTSGLLASASAATVTNVNDDDTSPATSNEDDFGAFAPPTSRTQTDKVSAKDMKDAKDFKDQKDQKGGQKGSRPKTPPPPLPPAGAKPVEDPSTWSQEFDEDTEFVDAADLLDEEPTINSKGGLGGKESVI
jgi:hypothetical protein